MISVPDDPPILKPRHDAASLRDLNAKNKLLGTIRAVKRDGLLGEYWPYGYVLHRGVIVVWDHDQDDRVLGVVDNIPPRHRRILLACHETKGSLSLLWACSPPVEYLESEGVYAPGGDSWSIIDSRELRAEVLL